MGRQGSNNSQHSRHVLPEHEKKPFVPFAIQVDHTPKKYLHPRSSDTFSSSNQKCINEQEEIEIDDWEMDNASSYLDLNHTFTPQNDDSQDPLFAETFSPICSLKK